MTGQEIKDAAEKYIDEAMDDTDAVEAINDGIAWLGDTALVYDSTTITAEKQTDYALPADLTTLVAVENSDGERYLSYSVLGDNIRFADADTYTVYYRRMPNPISALTDTPEIHEAYHRVLVTYVVAWYKLMDDDENPDGLRMMQKFERDATRVFAMLRRKRQPMKWTVVR